MMSRSRARRLQAMTSAAAPAGWWKGYVAVIAALALGGCASPPPDHFYSLSNGLPTAEAAAGALAGGAASTSGAVVPPYYIEVLAPSVPPQVARSQLVITSGAGRIDLLEQERWSAPLASEIGQALSLALSARLGAIDVFRTPAPEQAAIYRISTSVQRFESAPGQYALLDAVWSVRLAGSPKVLTCRSELKEPVASGYDALVDGHRRAVGRLADGIAAAVRRLAAGGAGC
ncbi:MAG TPA: PqiC family protein [Burkholderiaceae bacterium]|nr:PqiC family protein [Burkholderiaceae bacterium]